MTAAGGRKGGRRWGEREERGGRRGVEGEGGG